MLSDYVKLKGLINIPDEQIEEILYTITQGTKYEIINNAPRLNENTILHLAASHDHNEMLSLLLDNLSSEHVCSLFHILNNSRQTVLHCASKEGHHEVFEMLLEKIEMAMRCNILHLADDKQATVLLAGIARYDSNLRTIEISRRYLNDYDWVSLLADKNADGCTVLHLAAAYGHNDLIHFIKSKTDSQSVMRLLKEVDKNGLLPIFRSLNESTASELLDSRTGNELVEILTYNPSNQDPAFHTWTKAQCFDQPNPDVLCAIAKSVSLEEWIQLNTVRSENGYTALHWAAVSGHAELARLIAGNTKEKELGMYSCTTILRLLKQLDNRGYTALMKAAVFQDNAAIFAIVENLESGQLLDLLSTSYDYRRTIIHRFIQERRPTSILAVIFHLLDANSILKLLKQQEANNLTPLHLAACLGSIQTVEFLSEYLQVNSVSTFEVLSCVDGANETVIHCLAKQGKTDVANQLLSKVSWRQKYQLLAIRNKEGKTADQLTGKKSGCEQK